MSSLNGFRPRLLRCATADRPETGEAYVEKYQSEGRPQRGGDRPDGEGMGVVAPPGDIPAAVAVRQETAARCSAKQDDPAAYRGGGAQALRDGFPATALKLGKELWPLRGERKTEYAYELLDAAYAALGREVLRQVLRTHRDHRDLPSVDIFDAERDTGNGET